MTISLSTIVDVANAQVGLENSIEELELTLDRKKEELRKIATETLPNMMKEIGLESVTLPGGKVIKIADVVYAKLPDNATQAFDWLREKDMDGVIKTQVTLNFGKGEDEQLLELESMLREAGWVPNVKSTIHHMTLKALVKEQILKGSGIPLEAFGAGIIPTSVVTSK